MGSGDFLDSRPRSGGVGFMRKPPIRHPERARIQPFIPGDLRGRLAAFCAASGRSESSVVAEALKRSLDPLPDSQNVSEQLSRLDTSIRELLRYLKHSSRSTRPGTPSTASEG